MPKRKVASEDESSEEELEAENTAGSEEEESTSKSKSKKKESTKKDKPKTIKKPKIGPKPSVSKSTDSGNVKTNAEGDKYIDLGKKKRAVLRSFKGIPLLDIREYYGAEGEEKPGKKGISLQLEQWHELRDSASTIDELFTQLKK